jgi:hypothetical protein
MLHFIASFVTFSTVCYASNFIFKAQDNSIIKLFPDCTNETLFSTNKEVYCTSDLCYEFPQPDNISINILNREQGYIITRQGDIIIPHVLRIKSFFCKNPSVTYEDSEKLTYTYNSMKKIRQKNTDTYNDLVFYNNLVDITSFKINDEIDNYGSYNFQTKIIAIAIDVKVMMLYMITEYDNGYQILSNCVYNDDGKIYNCQFLGYLKFSRYSESIQLIVSGDMMCIVFTPPGFIQIGYISSFINSTITPPKMCKVDIKDYIPTTNIDCLELTDKDYCIHCILQVTLLPTVLILLFITLVIIFIVKYRKLPKRYNVSKKETAIEQDLTIELSDKKI